METAEPDHFVAAHPRPSRSASSLALGSGTPDVERTASVRPIPACGYTADSWGRLRSRERGRSPVLRGNWLAAHRLDRCSRWAERQDCGQACLKQIVADPENCLVWNIVSNWYLGRSCVCCHKRFGALHRLDHAPALMREDHTTIEWDQIRPEQLLEIFSTSRPVCWNCHIAETFRRVHPELVVDRKRKSADVVGFSH